MTRDQIILDHVPIVKAAVAAYITKNPTFSELAEDMEGESMLKLVVVVDKFLGKNWEFDVRFRQYLRLSIRNAIADIVRGADVLRVRRGLSVARQKFVEPLLPHHRDQDDVLASETFQTLLDCGKDDLDRDILELKALGWSIKAIAYLIDRSPKTVRLRLNTIEAAYERRKKTAHIPDAASSS